MTTALNELYDRNFFGEYSRKNARYQAACELIATEIANRFSPTSAIDWGCGTGLHVGALVRAGVDAIGVDGVLADDDLRDPDATIVIADLRSPPPLDGVPQTCDLSMCIDVLEHIEERDSAAALDHVIAGAELVILSCAPPHQGGHHHVNEQPRRYWVARMAELGWAYQRRETGAMENYFLTKRDVLTESWMYHNLCVYRRS